MTKVFFGVDVAKKTLEIASHQNLETESIENTKTGIHKWLKKLPENSCIGMESTGSYHRLLAELAHASGIVVYLLQPRDVKHYSKAVGMRAKTDPCDARLIARFVEKEHVQLRPFVPHDKFQLQLQQLLRKRATLVRTRGVIRQSFEDADLLKKEAQTLCKQVDKLINKIEATMNTLMEQVPQMSSSRDRLKSIPGVGDVVSAGLAVLFQRVPFKTTESAVAFVGFDPKPRESGMWIGKRRISKRGPSELRRLLYNAAMSAAKTEIWKPFYQRHREKGLSSTACLVILARKILKTAFSIWNKPEAVFEPERLKFA